MNSVMYIIILIIIVVVVLVLRDVLRTLYRFFMNKKPNTKMQARNTIDVTAHKVKDKMIWKGILNTLNWFMGACICHLF